MKIKETIERLVKHPTANETLLNIDYTCAWNDYLLVSGWAAHKILEVAPSISLLTKGGVTDIALVDFPRPDVVEIKSLPSSRNAFGFVGIIPANANNPKEIVFEFMGAQFPLSKQASRPISSVDELVDQFGGYSGLVVELLEKHGIKSDSGKRLSSLPVADKDIRKIQRLLDGVDIHSPDFFAKASNVFVPEIQRIWHQRLALQNQSDSCNYGDLPAQPDVSIIIPLYGRYDFMQHQLACFSTDSDFNQAEVIYVLDDPRLEHEVKVTAKGIHETFKFPFKVVFTEQNRGFAGANNLGASYAISDYLLLLNSDILPKSPGWLSSLKRQFDLLEKCGILGATLIYEDETIQHAGMEFREDPNYPGILINYHPYKGVPLSLVPLKELQKVQMVTGACMLIQKSLFDNLEGFDTAYVLGDYEDSDLCLKCINAGKDIYLSGTVVLYHLERLSQVLVDSGDWKGKLTLVNGVYQMNKWKTLLQDIQR